MMEMTMISKKELYSRVDKLVEETRAYGVAVEKLASNEVLAEHMGKVSSALDAVVLPHGVELEDSMVAFWLLALSLKKDKETGIRRVLMPSGATCRKYLKQDLFARLGVEFGACIAKAEPKNRERKEEWELRSMTPEEKRACMEQRMEQLLAMADKLRAEMEAA